MEWGQEEKIVLVCEIEYEGEANLGTEVRDREVGVGGDCDRKVVVSLNSLTQITAGGPAQNKLTSCYKQET